METTTNLQVMNAPVSEKRRRTPIAAVKSAYTAIACAIMGAMCCKPVYATATNTTTTIWTKANEIMKDVDSQVLLISTIAAVVTAPDRPWSAKSPALPQTATQESDTAPAALD